MCPDDCDLSCTLIIAEVKNTIFTHVAELYCGEEQKHGNIGVSFLWEIEPFYLMKRNTS